VPYTGATEPVNLGAYDLTVNGITVGKGAGNGSTNTAIGLNALSVNQPDEDNLIGLYNTASGYEALLSNTTGSYNTASGAAALYSNQTGDGNTAIGSAALYYNTAGGGNIAIGNEALAANSTGSSNTAIGAGALLSNVTGEFNTAIGYWANVGSDNLTNATAIGNGASVTTSNTIQLGNTDVTDVKTSGTITAGAVTYPNADGTNGYVLTTNGSGTATWVASTSITEVSDEFTATAGQTTFTISHAKGTNRTIKMYINGIRVSNTAYSDSSTTVSYNSTNNGGYTIVAGDRIQFDYSY